MNLQAARRAAYERDPARYLDVQIPWVLREFKGHLSFARLAGNVGDPTRPGCLVPEADVGAAVNRLIAAGVLSLHWGVVELVKRDPHAPCPYCKAVPAAPCCAWCLLLPPCDGARLCPDGGPCDGGMRCEGPCPGLPAEHRPHPGRSFRLPQGSDAIPAEHLDATSAALAAADPAATADREGLQLVRDRLGDWRFEGSDE